MTFIKVMIGPIVTRMKVTMPDQTLLEALAPLNPWGGRPFNAGFPRESRERLQPWLDRPETLALVGLRRSGKSTLMRQLAASLLDGGEAPQDILFVDFEHPVFLERPMDVGVLDRVFGTFRELVRPSARPYLFLDEVQEVDGWARWVRARTEAGDASITVTGSSSRLAEPEVAQVLTGRNLTTTLWPLSFSEFLAFRGFVAHPGNGPRLRQEGMAWMEWGGLPEIVLMKREADRPELLRQYLRDLLYRDVVARHGVRDVRALEQVAHHLLANTGNLVSFNRIKNQYGLSLDQVRSYTSFLEEGFLVRQVPRFSYKLSEQARAPRKVYAVDTGLRNAAVFRFSQDLGRLAETVVHNTLTRDESARLFYFVGRGEADFVVWKGTSAVDVIQVCFDDDDDVPDRETAGLVEAMQALDVRDGTILTARQTWDRDVDGRSIHARPLWDWVLERPA